MFSSKYIFFVFFDWNDSIIFVVVETSALADSQTNTIQFTDFVVCFSITSFGDLKDKIALAFRIYDISK